jgi:hypothetical protein
VLLCLPPPARADEPGTEDVFFHMPRPRWRHPVPADLRVDGIPWPVGAPPPPDLFVAELTLWYAAVLASRGATPAADIELHQAGDRDSLILATRSTGERSESAARLSVSLPRDHVWFTAGAATGDSLAVYEGAKLVVAPTGAECEVLPRWPLPSGEPREQRLEARVVAQRIPVGVVLDPVAAAEALDDVALEQIEGGVALAQA